MSDRVTLCPSCKEQIEPGAVRCVACEYALISPGGQRTVVTRRDTYGEMPQSANFPGVGPGRECEGCDGSIIEVIDGQVVGSSLVRCDDNFCYYESTPGGVV
jgi:hypothetical protein